MRRIQLHNVRPTVPVQLPPAGMWGSACQMVGGPLYILFAHSTRTEPGGQQCHYFDPLDAMKLIPNSQLWGEQMSNPIGLAAGFDKNGEAIDGMIHDHHTTPPVFQSHVSVNLCDVYAHIYSVA